MDTLDDVTFGRWLRTTLHESGVSRTQFIERMSGPGSSQRQNVYKWLNGERQPSWDSCQKIASVLGVDVDEVLEAAGHIHRVAEDVESSPTPRGQAHEGGSNPLTSDETVALRALLATHLTGAELVQLRRLLPILAGLGADDVAWLRAMRATALHAAQAFPPASPSDLGHNA